MRIHRLCVSKRPSDWVAAASTEYLKRLKGQIDIRATEIAPAARRGQASADVDREAAKLLRLCPQQAFRIALDEHGELWSTADLAARMNDWRGAHADVAFMIGGADGLAPSLKRDAACLWSLSRLTLPHQLARVVVIEQLYRAWSLLHNHPYHRA